MFFLFKKRKNRKVYDKLDSINFCGKIESNIPVVIKFPEDPTLFSFSLPAARKVEDYFHGTKYGIFKEETFPFISQFLRYIKSFPKEEEKLKRFSFRKTVLIDFELDKDKAGTRYPFPMRIGFMKDLFPALNVIYTLQNPTFPDYYNKVIINITGSKEEVKIKEHKTKRGWAWEYLKYLGMTQKKKILVVDIRKEDNQKIKRTVKEKHSDRWFPVIFDELHDISLDQKIALLLVADSFLFDTSYYAYFTTKEGIKSYKIGNLPLPAEPTSNLRIIEEKEILQLIK